MSKLRKCPKLLVSQTETVSQIETVSQTEKVS